MPKLLNKRYKKFGLIVLPVIIVIGLLVWYLSQHPIPIMEPAGTVAAKERNLIFIGLILAAIVVIPVYIITILILLKYRESNHSRKKVKYSPDWDHSRLFETIWWGIPIAIITILSVITWNSAHALDPFKSFDSNMPTLKIQAIALDWKWLFIYPDQHVASVSLAEIPANQPVDFYITSDTVMNSFWVPQLGGQIYAMPGMSTQLHEDATKLGSYNGWSANISGQGFANMTFTIKAVTPRALQNWINLASKSSNQLTTTAYNQLANPSVGNAKKLYSDASPSLYNDIINKYMMPSSPTATHDSSTSANNAMGMGM